MIFEPIITLGVLLHLVVLVAVIVTTFWKLRSELLRDVAEIREELRTRLAVVESKLDDLWQSWKRNGAD